jgi:hypothetical protein
MRELEERNTKLEERKGKLFRVLVELTNERGTNPAEFSSSEVGLTEATKKRRG